MDSIETEQGHWIQKLQSLSKRPLKVSRNVNGKPTKWVSLTDTELPADYRTILHNEIVIDIDAGRWTDVRMFAEIITETLVKLRIPYITAYSGGRGVHLHVFFDLSSIQKKICDKTDVMPKDLRVWLFEYILRNAGISPKLIGPGKPFDTSCVNWSDEGKGHLIRVFGGKKQKYKTFISEIPDEKPKNDEVSFPCDVDVWYIPETLFQEFIDHFKQYQKERVESIYRYQKASQNFTGIYLSLPCIQKILEGLPEGQRNAGAHIVSIACKLDNMPKTEAQKAMHLYAGNCSPGNISEKEYLGWLDWIYSQDEPFWNCRFCKELEVCKEESCRFYNATFQSEFTLLKNEDLVDNILKTLDKKIKKDKKNKFLVFLVCLSAYGSNPLNLFLKGESSIGKTHLAKSVAEYFPQDDVWFIGDMSPKALIHEHGQYRNGKTYVSLRNKILIFLESPRKETLEMLKPILSHDRTEIEYKIADKKASGQLGTKSVIIEGWPATIFCTTDYRFLEELSTRSMLTTPEVTQEKIQQVLEYKAAQYSRPWENVEDEEERILKGALELLKSDIKICVPYAEVLAQKYGKDEPRVMRDFDKLLGLISMSTFLHKEQRMRFEISTGSTYVIANEVDYWVGVSLFGSVRETTCTGIPQPVIDFYENIVKRIEGVISYKSMRETYVKVHKKPLSRTHLRNRFVEPLESVGWLNREQDPNDKRSVVFEKCRIEPENTETMEEYDASYFKEIFPEEQLEEYMRELEKIWNKNEECNTKGECGNGECDDCDDTDYAWFYMKRVPYFLEENKNVNKEIKDEDSIKNENSINPNNSKEIIANNKMDENTLIDQYDEETVLLQIPQDDTRVEDVVKRFKDQNKVVDTIVVLKDKGKIIAGVINSEGYMRRVSDTSRAKDPDVPRPGLNRWTCGECGTKFYSQEPYRNHNDHAICDECAEKLVS